MTEQPSGGPYQPYGAGPTLPYQPPAPDHPQTTAILILGIVGVSVFQICAPIAWYLGSKAKKEIEASNGALGGLPMVNLGRVLGIVGTAIIAVGALIGVVAIVIIVIAARAST
jgi:hypothetical protein